MQDIEQVEKVSPENLDNEIKTTSIGKFEDSDELLKAYNNLEAEFTRKSQLLKELTKSEGGLDLEKKEALDIPVYDRPEWQEQLNSFLEKNPLAKGYAKELATVLVEDDALSRDKHCLEVALSRVLAARLTNPEKILEDEKMRNYVLSDKDIKDTIIKNYLDSLSSISAPKTIAKGGEITAVPPRKVTTIEEAGALAAEFIKNRRK